MNGALDEGYEMEFPVLVPVPVTIRVEVTPVSNEPGVWLIEPVELLDKRGVPETGVAEGGYSVGCTVVDPAVLGWLSDGTGELLEFRNGAELGIDSPVDV